MYRTGRSRVSAITQTPASGPFELVTTPPMSSLSMATAAPACCWACGPVMNHERAITAQVTVRRKASTWLRRITRSFRVGEWLYKRSDYINNISNQHLAMLIADLQGPKLTVIQPKVFRAYGRYERYD